MVQDSSDYALWYAFAVEHLARAALCGIHPVLNADPQHLQSLLYGIDVVRTERPKSLPIHAVYIRLMQLIEGFTKTHKSFCGEMANRRNAELHSAERPFDGLRTESWLARYYEVAEILCSATNHSLKELFGEDEAEGALRLIEASRSSSLAKVKKGWQHTNGSSMRCHRIGNLNSKLLPPYRRDRRRKLWQHALRVGLTGALEGRGLERGNQATRIRIYALRSLTCPPHSSAQSAI